MKNYLIANWKQNKTHKEIEDFFAKFSKIYSPKKDLEVVICAPFIYVPLVKRLLDDHELAGVKCGSQDVSLHTGGPHTGEVSAAQLKDYCEYCIVGHSERGESVSIAMQKCFNAVNVGLTPFLCLASTNEFLVDYDEGFGLVWEDPSNISKDGVFRVKSEDEFNEGLKEILDDMPTERPLIYGGSVNEDNAEMMLKNPKINGFLVGKSSLDPDTFNNLVKKFK